MAIAYNVIIHVFLMLFLLTVHNFFFFGGGGGILCTVTKGGNFVLHFTMCT